VVLDSEGVGRLSRSTARSVVLLLVALAIGGGILAACGSSGSVGAPAASPKKVAITAVLPMDAASEPPWNGRFVQVTVSAPQPAAMAAQDWKAYVNGKKQPLAGAPSILPFAPGAATVGFVFQAPFGDLGEYTFKVVYAPAGGPKVERSWRYQW
jgi:hypothetical protein